MTSKAFHSFNGIDVKVGSIWDMRACGAGPDSERFVGRVVVTHFESASDKELESGDPCMVHVINLNDGGKRRLASVRFVSAGQQFGACWFTLAADQNPQTGLERQILEEINEPSPAKGTRGRKRASKEVTPAEV